MLGLYVVVLLLTAILGALSDTLASLVAVIGFLGVFGFGIWNQIIRTGQTGQSIGKEQQGVALLDNKSGQPIGGGKTFGRVLLGSIIDNICLINTLWIFFDSDNQRLADKVVDANVFTKS